MKNRIVVLACLAVVIRLSAQVEVVSSGNVGIGTTAPNYSLTIFNPSIPRLQLVNSATGQNWSDGFQAYLTGVDAVLLNKEAGGLYLGTDNAYRMTIDATGNVGIGAISPAGRLHLNSSGHTSLILDTTGQSSPYLSFRQANTELGYIQYQDNGSGTDYLTYYAPMHSFQGGNVGIGTAYTSYKLHVVGTVRGSSFISDTTSYADFVFKPGYELPALSEVEAHIQEHGHLPGIPSEAEAREHGIDLAAMQVKLLQKIEELTLHQIAQEKRLSAQAERISALEQENQHLRHR